VDGHSGRPLQLTRSPAAHAKTAFEVAVIIENLVNVKDVEIKKTGRF